MKKRNNDNTVPTTKSVKTTLAKSSATAQPIANAIAFEANILECFRDDLRADGFAGELETPCGLYLVKTSRVLNTPISCAVKGESAAGKSYVVTAVAKHFPKHAVLTMTSMSDKALFHMEEQLKHAVLFIGERHGAANEQQDYVVRELISNGYIEQYSVKPGKGGHTKKHKKAVGPVSVVTTSTADLHPENETRLLALHIDESRKATTEIMKAIARSHDGTRKSSKPKYSIQEWQDFQSWISTQPNAVNIPFAQTLADLIAPNSIRLRRDFGKLMGLISAHTLLHRKSRSEKRGELVAKIADYRVIWKILRRVFALGVEQSVDPVIRQTVDAVRDFNSPTMSLEDLAKALGIDKSNAGRRYKKAEEAGFLMNRGAGVGRPHAIALANAVPADDAVLPTPKAVRKAWKAAQKKATGA